MQEQVTHEGDFIYINIKNANKLAYTEYDKELFELLKSSSWHKKPKGEDPFGYVHSSKLGLLHHVVMKYWYGEEQYNRMMKKGYKVRLQSENNRDKYIIEHTNNNGFDCRISNLYFYNTIKNSQIKGKYFDKLLRNTCYKYPMSIFNDFKKGKFQITIGFNCLFCVEYSDKTIPLQSMKLLYKPETNYDIDYSIVLNDAERILEMFLNNQRIPLSTFKNALNYKELRFYYAPLIKLKPEEKNLKPGSIIRRKKEIFILAGEGCGFAEVAPDKDWFGTE